MSDQVSSCRVITCTWQNQTQALHGIRRRVFIDEQQVPEELEWDEEDIVATHFLAIYDPDTPVGVARLLSSGQIGRMCVLPEFRRSGIASQLLTAAENEAIKQGITAVFLHAQCYISHFYARHGYVAEGEEFMDAGIPHVAMSKSLKQVAKSP